jgi:hypothetical protein
MCLADEVGTVIKRYLRPMVQSRIHVAVVPIRVLTSPRENRDTVMHNQCRRNIVLGAKGIARAKHELCPSSHENARKVAGFGRYVQAAANPCVFKRPLHAKAVDETCQNRHLGQGPIDSPKPLVGKRWIADI